jgi:hypothetical protein
MFTLDSTTLFYYNLRNDIHPSQIAAPQIQSIDEWAQGVPAHAGPNSNSVQSAPSLPGLPASKLSATSGYPASTTSRRSAIQARVNVKVFSNGGISDRDERVGAEADLARASPRKGIQRLSSKVGYPISIWNFSSDLPLKKNLVRVKKQQDLKPKLTAEEKRIEKQNHPLLGTKEFRQVGVPTAIAWGAAEMDPWTLGGDTVIRRAFKKIADVIWLDGSEDVDDRVLRMVCGLLK